MTGGMGTCKALPPTVVILGHQPHPMNPKLVSPLPGSLWPDTPEHEWCGSGLPIAAPMLSIDLGEQLDQEALGSA
jgi:hypothetical protein